jgi:hypothetical protein
MSFALSPNYREALPLVQRSIAAGSITGSYQIVGSTFGQGVVELIIYSSLDQSVQISLDGANDFIPIPAGAVLILDLKNNLTALGGWRGVYVKTLGNPTTGSLYVSGIGVQ